MASECDRARTQRIKSLRARPTRINQSVASNSGLYSNGSGSVIEDRGPQNYVDQLKLYEAAKENNVDDILNFFDGRDETLEELAPSFIYKSFRPLNNTLLHVAASFGSRETVHLIADLIGPSILTRRNSNGDTALHVAAKAGHVSTAITLIHGGVLATALHDLLELENEQGNTALHEALINGHIVLATALIKEHPKVSFYLNKESKSPFYLAVEAGSLRCIKFMLQSTREMNPDEREKGKSPIHAAIPSAPASERTATVQDILECMFVEEPRFINLPDEEGRTALHLAASVGYLEVVRYLLGKYVFLLVQMDKSGFLPIHMAAMEGHVGIIKELLLHCPDLGDMIGGNFQNFLHVAAKSGASNVVNYVLITPELGMLINQRDKDGNTPLHLATMNWHPKIVSALTWDERVDLKLVNNERLTARDAAEYHMEEVATFRQRLTLMALKAAGAPGAPTPKILNADRRPIHSEPRNRGYYKDTVNTLLLVSTLVVTVTFAAGFTMPGGNNDSDPDQGMAAMLGHSAFRIFIFCDAMAMYSSIMVAVTLLWAQLGDLHLVQMALTLALPLLGTALIMMTSAFMAGIYLVVSKLGWLGIAVLVMGALFLMVLSLLLLPFFLPVWSSNRILRHMAYYLFHLLILVSGSYTTVNEEK